MKKKYENELNILKTRLLYENYLQSFFALTAAVIAISWLLYSENGQASLKSPVFLLWLPVSCLIYTIKLVLSLIYRKRYSYAGVNEPLWRHIFYFSAALTGGSLGATVLFVDRFTNPTSFIVVILILGMISVAASGTISTNLRALVIFNTMLIIPYVAFFAINRKTLPSMIITVYCIVLYMTSKNTTRAIEKSLKLKLENDRIIEKMEQSEIRFTKSFHSGVAPMALIMVENLKFIDINNAFLNLLNYSRKEVTGKTPFELQNDKDPGVIVKLVEDAIRERSIRDRKITLFTRDGRKKHCLVTVEMFTSDNDQIALCMLQDFTERLDYEKRLQDERDRYETAASVKARFLATMSHEIRTPMNSIIGMTSLAMFSDDIGEKNDYLGVVKESADYLLVLLNDILDISSIESGRVRISLVDTDLHKLVKNSCRTMEMFARNRKLGFAYRIDDNVPRYVKAPPERLRQVLINLISNAVKFTPDGNIELTVRLSGAEGYPEAAEPGQYIEFAVKDTGIGIPENKIKSIFDSFTQGDESTFRKYGGTGLGLTISKQLIKLMKGHITVESTLGIGSTFRFIIPLITGNPPDSDIEQIFSLPVLTSLKRILVAEDNIMNQKLITALMKKTGHEYALVENGADAIDLLKKEKFDAVIMDLEMPVMNGKDALIRIREGEAGQENTGIPVYAMSAHVMNDVIETCLAAGFNGYITKPLDFKKLKELLQ